MSTMVRRETFKPAAMLLVCGWQTITWNSDWLRLAAWLLVGTYQLQPRIGLVFISQSFAQSEHQ